MNSEDFLSIQESTTPYLERVRALYEKAGISTILVAGSSGAFFHAADTVIQMDHYEPEDITERVKTLCLGQKAPRLDAADFKIPDCRKDAKMINTNCAI